MAHAYETRHRRNGAIDLRDDMATLQKDISQLTGDIGDLISLRAKDVRKRVDGGGAQVGKSVRAHPIAAVGVAAGAGLLAGVLAAGLARRRR